MKKMKKLLCTILAIAVFASTLSLGFVTVSAEDNTLLSEGQEGLLRQLGITLSGDVINYDNPITRGEMAHILARVLNLPFFSGTESYFYDVSMEYLYANDIMALVDAGVVHGDGNGKYRPDDRISDAEICKLFVMAIGFNQLEDMVSYQKFARSNGITDGINSDGIITYAEALRMAYNTLHSGMYEKHTFGATVTGKVNPNFLALEMYHGLLYKRGIVDGISSSILTHVDTGIPVGSIRIEGTLYSHTDESLMGHSVVYYIKKADKDKARPEIQYIYSNEELTNTVTIQSEDIVGMTANGTYAYMVGKNERELKLVAHPDIIYNGVAYPACSDEELKPASGFVTWIDNNGDRIYDLVSVTSYEYLVVDSVNADDMVIFGKYPTKTIGDPERETTLEMVYGLVNTYLSVVKSGDVLAIKRSKNESGVLKLRIEMLGSDAFGTIEGISGDRITVNGKSFRRTSATVTDTEPRLGDIVNIYGHNGAAAAIIHAENDNYQYGYLLDVANRGGGLSNKFEIRLVTQEREMKNYFLASKVFLDETKISCNETAGNQPVIMTKLVESANIGYRTGAEDKPYAQLIRFKVNNDGVVTHIDTATYDSEKELKTSLQKSFSMADADYTTKYDDKPLQFYTTSRSFVSSEKGRSVFVAPPVNDIWHMDPTQRDDLDYWGSSDLGTKQYSKARYIVEAYNVDEETLIADQVVLYDSSGGLSDPASIIGNRPGIVSKLGKVLSEEGDSVYQIELTGSASAATSYTMHETVVNASAVKVGDVVDVVTSNGKVKAISILFSPKSGMLSANPYTKGNQIEYYQNVRVAYGRILSFKENYLLHTTTLDVENTPKNELDHYYSFKIDTTPIYIYDTKRPDLGITQGIQSDVQSYNMNPESGQTALICSGSARLSYIYIIK